MLLHIHGEIKLMDSIKKIWICLYVLIKKRSKEEYTGALLKVLFSKDKIGYGNLHPLPYFGEGSLSDYIHLLKNLDLFNFNKNYLWSHPIHGLKKVDLLCKQKKWIRIILQDIWMDAQARSLGRSLLFGYAPIKSHYLISNIYAFKNLDHLPFGIFKIKMGRFLKEETTHLKKIIQNSSRKLCFRLDFNERISKQDWEKWETENTDILSYIDYVEDPYRHFSYIPSKIYLAQDWSDTHYCPVRVIKASRYSLNSIYRQLAAGRFQRVVFTHSLTHPLEARLSWVKTAQFYAVHPGLKEICGLNYPLNYYEKNDFSFLDLSSQLYSPLGTGLGFDTLLEKQNWKLLCS